MSSPANRTMANSLVMAGNLEWQLEQERLALVQALNAAGAEVPDCLSQSLLAGVESQPDDDDQLTTKEEKDDA